MSLTLYVDGAAGAPTCADRRGTPAWSRSPRATATASACRRLAAQCADRARRRHPRGRHLRRGARGRDRRSPATCWCSRRGGRSRPGARRDDAGRVIHTVGRLEDLAALLGREPRRPRRARAAHLDAPARLRRPGAARGGRAPRRAPARARLEGVALHLPLAARLPPRRGRAADQRRGRRRAPDPARVWVSHLTDGRAGVAARVVRPTSSSARGSAPTCGSATATRCRRRATVLDVHPVERGDVFGYRGRSAPKAGHHPRRLRRHRARHRPRGADRRQPRSGTGPPPGPRRPRRGRLRALAVHRRRQAAALRRAAAHAGLDAVPPARRPGARRSATRSRSGCATPRRAFDRVVDHADRPDADAGTRRADSRLGPGRARAAGCRGPRSRRGRARPRSGCTIASQ